MPSKVVSRQTIKTRKGDSSPDHSSDSDSQGDNGSITVEGIQTEGGRSSVPAKAVPSVSEVNPTGLPGWRTSLLIFSLLTGMFLSLMDTFIISTAIYTISDELGGVGDATWTILGYSLAYVGFTVIITRISDVVGRKPTVITSFVVFIAASLGCGFSQTLAQLVACRVLQGLGGAGLYALPLVMLPEISPLRLLPLISSLIGLVVSISGVLGPIIGGVITRQTTWRWIFWLNGPVGSIVFIVFVLACPRRIRGYQLSEQKFRNIDFFGCFLMIASSVLFVFGLQEAGIGAYEWSSSVIICAILFGCLAGICLVFWEFFLARTRKHLALIMPTRIMTDRVMLAGILAALLTGFSNLVWVYSLPLRFQIVNLNNSESAGLHILPYLGALALGAFAGGAASSKKNNAFGTFMIASFLILIGNGVMSTIGDGIHPGAKVYGFQVIQGFGVGLTFATMTIMSNLQVDFRDHAVAQGLIAQARVLGGSIGIAASNAIFRSQTLSKLQGVVPTEQLQHLQTSSEALKNLTLTQLNAIRLVFASSFNESMRMCTYVAAVGVIISAFTWQANPPNILRRKAQLEAAIAAVVQEQDMKEKDQA